MKTYWQDQNCKFRSVTERKGIAVCTLVITGAKNCFETVFLFIISHITSTRKIGMVLQNYKWKHCFLKESILLEYTEQDKMEYQAQNLCIISQIK